MSWTGARAPYGAIGARDIADRVSNLSFTFGDVVVALAVVVVAWVVSRYARRAVLRASAELGGVSTDLRDLGARLAGYLVLFVGFGIALGVIGVQIQPVLAVVLLIGVVLALALRGIAENFAAGIVIQTRRPVRLGDQIEGLGYDGIVHELNSRAVVIETADGRVVHLPNHQLLDNPIVNYTSAGHHRAEIEVRVGTAGGDTQDIARLVRAAAESVSGVLDEPEPAVLVAASEHERLTLVVRVWHDPLSASVVASAAVQAISDRLHRAGHRAVVVAPPPAPPLTPPAPL